VRSAFLFRTPLACGSLRRSFAISARVRLAARGLHRFAVLVACWNVPGGWLHSLGGSVFALAPP